MSAAKQKGTSAETSVVNWLKERGYEHVERRTLQGSKDRGDIAGIPNVVIEVKNCAKMELSQWISELLVEMKNDDAETGVVIHKKRGTTKVEEWYATLPAGVWLSLLQSKQY